MTNIHIQSLIQDTQQIEAVEHRAEYFTNQLFNLHADMLITDTELDEFYNYFE